MSTYSPKFVLNFATGSVSFPLSHAGATELQSILTHLMQQLHQRSGSPPTQQPQPPTDYAHTEADLRFEVFCNPNIWPSPHAAKVLITLKHGSVRLSTETELPRVMEDLSQFLEA